MINNLLAASIDTINITANAKTNINFAKTKAYKLINNNTLSHTLNKINGKMSIRNDIVCKYKNNLIIYPFLEEKKSFIQFV